MDLIVAAKTRTNAQAYENAINIDVPKGQKRPLRITIACLLFLLCAIMAFYAYIAWQLARPVIIPPQSNPLTAINTPYFDIQFPSSDHRYLLDGWYIPGDSDKTVIFSHGYGSNREEFWVPFYDLAKALHEQNYNVIMFDYGNSGSSHNYIASGGVRESKQLLGAIQLARSQGAEQIFIWGFSMGAGTALQAALESPDISGMILDSTFLLNSDTLYYNLEQYINLPRFPSVALIRMFFPLMNGVSLKQIPFQKAISTKYDIPLLIVHGEEDRKAPYQIAESIYDHQKGNADSELWLIPQGVHELLYRADKPAYLDRTIGFLQNISNKPDNPLQLSALE